MKLNLRLDHFLFEKWYTFYVLFATNFKLWSLTIKSMEEIVTIFLNVTKLFYVTFISLWTSKVCSMYHNTIFSK